MATDVGAEDDDAWLYGDNSSEDQRKEEIHAIYERATEDVPVPGEESPILPPNGSIIEQPAEITENGDTTLDEPPLKDTDENEERDSDEDEDSDDDDVQITIGDIKPSATTYPYGGTPVNLNIKRGSTFATGGAVGSAVKSKGIDIETIGVINDVSIYEFNLDSIEDKPWRKPGADITDYFNYGFNEDSWKAYCEKQRKLRLDNNVSVIKPQIVPGLAKDQQIPIATVNENSKYSGIGALIKKAGPPPGRRMSGSIDVICGANSANRRSGNSKENVIQVIGRGETYDGAVPGILPTHIPPPFIPPNLSVPPPGLPPGIPPAGVPPPVPFPDLYGNPIFTQPPPPVPNVSVDNSHQYDEQFFTGQPAHSYDNSDNQRSWNNSPRDRDGRDRHRDRSRDKDRERDRYWDRDHEREPRSGRAISEEEFNRKREEYERRRAYREYRDRREKERHDRDYERDYYDRDHEREDKRDSRERDRDRDRKHRERDYKDREERHRDRERTSRRRHHHEDDEESHHSSSSSRHKHSTKKIKREKDDSTPSTADVSDSTSQQEVLDQSEKA